MTKHPQTRLDRIILSDKKKKNKRERVTNKKRKLSIEYLKEQEAERELRDANSKGTDLS